MHGKVLGFVCLLLSTFPTLADDWKAAVSAFDTQRYEDVFTLLAPLAQPENVGVQLLLIDTFAKGHRALSDDAARLDWARRGAKLGIAPAQDTLALHYFHGDGLVLDEARAVYWFERAADQWYAPAVYNLAVATMNGQGTPADPDYAVRLFQRAADLDEPYALYVLGGMYLEGVYLRHDFDLSLYYLSRAAFLGQRRAMALMGILIQERQDDPNRQVKSAFHFRRAQAAGCDDIGELLTEAVARLSPEEAEFLEFNLAAWQPDIEPFDMDLEPGRCLS